MPVEKVVRDESGKVINIGPWDDMEGENPMPDGCYECSAEIVTYPDGGRGVRKPVSSTLEERLFALAMRMQAIEAENERLRALVGGPVSAPPPELEAEREAGESDADFRKRMRETRATLYSRMMGAREGVGEFTSEDRVRLDWLQSMEWLGPE